MFGFGSQYYRPGQPNWDYTIRKLQDISSTQILHEINFEHFEAPKTAILIIWAALNFEFLEFLHIFKCEILKKSKFKASLFWRFFNLPEIQPKLISRKIRMAEKLLNFHTVEYPQQLKIPIKLSRSVLLKKGNV